MIRMIKYLTVLSVTMLTMAAHASILLDEQTRKPIQVVKPIPIDLKIQNFSLPNSEQLKVQLRYVNEKLKFIAFRNVSKAPLEVRIFSHSYALADGNELSIHAPNVKKLVVEVAPYIESAGKESVAEASGNMYLFSLQGNGYYALSSSY